MSTFGTRLAQARKKRGMTPQGLADLLKIRQETIANLERGKHKEPRGHVIVALAKALGVTTDYLLGCTRKRARPTDDGSAVDS